MNTPTFKVVLSTTLMFTSGVRSRSEVAMSISRSIPPCPDLDDNHEPFYVPALGIRSCSWLGINDNWKIKCNDTAVMENCPVSCKTPCVTQPAAIARTYASDSIYAPDLKSSRSLLELEFCDDLFDTKEQFILNKIQDDNRLRSCKWAGRRSEKILKRCGIDAVLENCPVLCKVPCKEADNDVPTISPTNYQDPGIAQANQGPKTGDSELKLPVILSLSVLGGIVLAVMVAAAIVSARRNEEDDPCSLKEEDSIPEKVKQSLSFISADRRRNLGIDHFPQKAPSCRNYPCEMCGRVQRENYVFVPVKKGWIRRKIQRVYGEDDVIRDAYLQECPSEVTDDFSPPPRDETAV